MHQATTEQLSLPAASSHDVLTEILRDGATQMLAQAIEAEVEQWIELFRGPLIRTQRSHPSHASRGCRGWRGRQRPAEAWLEAPTGSRW